MNKEVVATVLWGILAVFWVWRFVYARRQKDATLSWFSVFGIAISLSFFVGLLVT